MTKFILIMFICSGLPGNECKPIPTPLKEFDTYRECALFGYDYSSTMLREFDMVAVNDFKMFTAFSCEEQNII